MSFFSRLRRTSPTKPAAPAPDFDTSLGAILLRMQAVDPDQLAAALKERATKEDALLGEWLSAHHVCRPEAIQTALSVQKKFRDGDTSGALLEMLEARWKLLAEGEKRIAAAIDSARQECERSGFEPDLWLAAMTPHAAE